MYSPKQVLHCKQPMRVHAAVFRAGFVYIFPHFKINQLILHVELLQDING